MLLSSVSPASSIVSLESEDQPSALESINQQAPSHSDRPDRIFSRRISLRRLSQQPTVPSIAEDTPPPSPFRTDWSASSSDGEANGDWRHKHLSDQANSFLNELEPSTSSLRTTVRVLQDCRLSLVHIPLKLYPHFLQPILSLILPLSTNHKRFKPNQNGYANNGDEDEEEQEEEVQARDQGNDIVFFDRQFINISITPIECSVVCSKESAEGLFQPIVQSLGESLQDAVVITEDTFVVIQVEGEGLDAGRRVLELTSPLALAGIPIFFITTYFSDYILVPSKSRSQVTKALQKRGFFFEKHMDAFVNSSHRHSSSTSSMMSLSAPPPTPPPTISLSDLQAQTFKLLKKHNVVPQVSNESKLLLCAGRRSSADSTDGSLYLGLVRALITKPEFLSLTLTESEPPSLLLQEDMLSLFGDEDTLLGSKEDTLIPITLDLRDIPLDSTGIVCDVAGRLGGQNSDRDLGGDEEALEPIGMSYLSTARAGTVMVAEDDLQKAITALQL